MGRTKMNALIVLLGFVSAALAAVPAHFPHGKIITYKYTADAKAGVIQPAPFASQFGIECHLHVKHDDSDPTLKNAYYVALTDVKHGLHNGHAVHHEHLSVMQPIAGASKMIETPFLIVYDENGNFQGVKFSQDEVGWSRNIKKSIASMLQLDLTSVYAQSPMKTHSFITHEDTIHGTCQVAYNVHPMDQTTVHPTWGNVFVVTKLHEPRNCSDFSHRILNHVEPEDCHVEEEDGMTTSARRVFEIEDQGSEIVIQKVVGHGTINYLPWMGKSEAHYLLTNQTMILENIAPVHEVQLPVVDFANVPITRSMVFEKSNTHYVPMADVDVTHGRHVVKLNELTFKLKKMLDEAAGYLKESHLERKQPDWKHGQTINRLLHVMSMMDVASLEQVYQEIRHQDGAKEESMKNIFLGIVPNVGTAAACLFTRNVIHSHNVSNWTAIAMLSELPMHVKMPTKELLMNMDQLLNLDYRHSNEVRAAGIFCFASLMHKTFRHDHPGVVDRLLDRYLVHFMDHIKNEPTYRMKSVYMMAMKNVRLNAVLKHLEPIIRGDLMVSEMPHNIRLQAIWAVKHVVADLPHYTHDLLWPILSDASLPVALRIVAYDVLMHQLPHPARLINVQWLMVNEKNEHLYNYHVDTIRGLANSVDPCLAPVREAARKVLAFTRVRNVLGPLSSKIHVDYMDQQYGHGETVMGSLVLDQLTGMPYVGSVEHIRTIARRPVTRWGVYWNIDGLSEILRRVRQGEQDSGMHVVRNEKVKNVLAKAAADMPPAKEMNANVILTMNNNVVLMLHASKDTWQDNLNELKQWKTSISRHMDNMNWQAVSYQNHFEMHVPTDLGVPAVLASRIPSFDSVRMSVTQSGENNIMGLGLRAKYQGWMHGEYVMSIYNPIADVWHSVRRTASQDIVLPVEMNVGYNQETKNLKITLPRLPVTDYSVAGITTSGKNYVTITDDENDMLRNSCATCRHHEMVAAGVANPKIHENVFDSKDTGLRFTMAVYDCENNLAPLSPVGEWLRVLSDPHKNTMGYKLVQLVMAVRQQMMNDLISGQGASCTKQMRVEPSIVYPTSMIDLTGKLSIQDLDQTHEKLEFISSKRIDVRGTVNAKAASTNESVRQWDMNVNVVLSQGHVNNSMKVMITRTTPEERNLKICVEAQKEYHVVNSELLSVDVGKKETSTKVTMTMGQTKEDKCVRDDMDVTMTVKGEVSEEQSQQIAEDNTRGTCLMESRNPFFHEASNIPKTWACIDEAIVHSTLRKYTINMALRKVPPNLASNMNIIQDVLRGMCLPQMKYSWSHAEPGNAKVVLEFPSMTPVLDMQVSTPTHSYELVRLPFGHPVWNWLMDNTHYDVVSLTKKVSGQLRPCTVYPRILITFDNGTIPFLVPDKWTLIAGDHVEHTFGFFVKQVQNEKMALKVFVGEHEVEFMPTDTGSMYTVNGRAIDNYEKGVALNIGDSYAIRVTKSYGHLMVDSQVVPVYIIYAPSSVLIFMSDELQGQVTGMCGHMDGTQRVELPIVHSASNF